MARRRRRTIEGGPGLCIVSRGHVRRNRCGDIGLGDRTDAFTDLSTRDMLMPHRSEKPKHDLLLGFCNSGPYRYARGLITSPNVTWVSWGYATSSIEESVLQDLRSRKIRAGRQVLFATWEMHVSGPAEPLRFGTLDFAKLFDGYAALTVHLHTLPGARELPKVMIGDTPSRLFRYLQDATS